VNVASARVVERRELAPDRVLLWLSAPEVSRGARPGQFVMVHPSGTFDPFLPRAFWIHRLRDGEDGEELALLVQRAGRGASMIADAVPGQRLQVTGPLGRPLSFASSVRSLLLVAEGIGVAPLVWCSDEETDRGRSVTLLLGAASAADLYPLDLVRSEVEVLVATEDGSAGSRGSVRSLVPEYMVWADQIVVAGPDRLYETLAVMLRRALWRRPCTVLTNAQMPCGTGVCGMCGMATRRKGVKLACFDGPAFELRDLW
jgi:dihydroorotate dehydrogenase electron transfer subunit